MILNSLSGVRYSIDDHAIPAPETAIPQSDMIFVSGQKIPKLHLSSNREADAGNLLASRSTRRQNLTNHLTSPGTSTMGRVLNEMARTLGICYLTNDVGWLLDKERHQKTEKSTQRFLGEDRTEPQTVHALDLNGKDASVIDTKKTKTHRKPVAKREGRRATEDPKLGNRESLGRFNGNYDWAKREGLILTQGSDSAVFDLVKCVCPKLHKRLKQSGQTLGKEKYFSIFSHPKFIKRAMQWFKKGAVEYLDMLNLIRFLERAFTIGCSVVDYGELLILLRARLFENEMRYNDAKNCFYNLIAVIIKDPSHFVYKLAVLVDYDPLIKSIRMFSKNADCSAHYPSRELEAIINMLYEVMAHEKLIQASTKFKIIRNLLIKLSEAVLSPKKELSDSSDHIMGVWLSHMCISEDIRDSELFKKLTKVIKTLLLFSVDKKLKAAYFRTIYLTFLRLYSSLHKYCKSTHLAAIAKLLNLLRSVCVDKKNGEVASVIRQFNVVQFLGKEFDLEYQVFSLQCEGGNRIQTVSELEDPDVGSHVIPKLNLDLCLPPKSRKNTDVGLGGGLDDAHVPKLNLNMLAEGGNGGVFNDDQMSRCNERYSISTRWRKIYAHPAVHKECLKLLLSVLLAEGCNSLEEEFTGQYPIQSGKLHYLFYLQSHLSYAGNKEFLETVIGGLKAKIGSNSKACESILEGYEHDFLNFAERQMTLKHLDKDDFTSTILTSTTRVNSGVYRLLKLLGHTEHKVVTSQKIGEGGYSVVYSVKNDRTKAVKIIQSDNTIYDRNALFYLFNEVSTLEYVHGKNAQNLCLYDFGVSLDLGYYLLFPLLNKHLDTDSNVLRTLAVFEDVCREVADLHDYKVVHYDIKRDNVMLCGDRAILVDYGEALQNEPSLRLRGTEVVRAPEMLLSGLEAYEFDQIQGPCKYRDTMALYKRHSKYNVGSACDIWGLGCLLFELYVGEFLFHSKDWSNYFYMVTNDAYTIVNEHVERKLDNNFFLIGLLKYVLVRNAQQRPSCRNVLKKVKAVRRLLSGDCVNTSRMSILRKLDTK